MKKPKCKCNCHEAWWTDRGLKKCASCAVCKRNLLCEDLALMRSQLAIMEVMCKTLHRDAHTLRLIVKHRLSICAPVLPSHPDWNAFSGDGGNDSYGRTIHVAVRRAAKAAR